MPFIKRVFDLLHLRREICQRHHLIDELLVVVVPSYEEVQLPGLVPNEIQELFER